MTLPAYNKNSFYSNGKLLLTGEYTVLDGAIALALPTKHGQYLYVEPGSNKRINWKSIDADGSVWYEDSIPFSAIAANEQFSTKKETKALINILHQAAIANPGILSASEGFTITTQLTFPRKWGLGTSSTLINNIAQWFDIDAYNLQFSTFGGSGYDIACARYNFPVLYWLTNGKPKVKPADFNVTFSENLWFVYLNQKQDSRDAIRAYRQKKAKIEPLVNIINRITDAVCAARKAHDFAAAIGEHEAVMCKVLETPTVKTKLFPDFGGTLKSLGAWGGDFILAVSENDPTDYFTQRGFKTIIPYKEMILK